MTRDEIRSMVGADPYDQAVEPPGGAPPIPPSAGDLEKLRDELR